MPWSPTVKRALVSVYLAALAPLACGPSLGGGDGPSASSRVTVDIAVPSAPPADKPDVKPAAPGLGYIWVAGHWDNLDGNYIWKEGRWLQARPDYEYIRARYDFDAGKQQWIYHRPHWKKRHAAAPAPVAAPAPTVDPAAPHPPLPDGGT